MYYTKKAWAVEEEGLMLDAIRRGEAFEQIAKRHDRTPNAIRLRFGLVCKKELETRSIEEVCRSYNTAKAQVERCVGALEEIQKKNVPPNHNPDPATLDLIKEEVMLLHEKVDKIYKHIRRMVADKKKS